MAPRRPSMSPLPNPTAKSHTTPYPVAVLERAQHPQTPGHSPCQALQRCPPQSQVIHPALHHHHHPNPTSQSHPYSADLSHNRWLIRQMCHVPATCPSMRVTHNVCPSSALFPPLTATMPRTGVPQRLGRNLTLGYLSFNARNKALTPGTGTLGQHVVTCIRRSAACRPRQDNWHQMTPSIGLPRFELLQLAHDCLNTRGVMAATYQHHVPR